MLQGNICLTPSNRKHTHVFAMIGVSVRRVWYPHLTNVSRLAAKWQKHYDGLFQLEADLMKAVRIAHDVRKARMELL